MYTCKFVLFSCDCCESEDEADRGGVESEGVRGEDVDGGVSRAVREAYSSIQLIKIPLSKKPVKFR